MANIPKDFSDLSIYSKAHIIGNETGKRSQAEHYDFVSNFNIDNYINIIQNCRILRNEEVFGGTIYKLAMKSSLFKNIAENSKYKPLKIFSKIKPTAEDTDFSRALSYSQTDKNTYWVSRAYDDNYCDYVNSECEENYTYDQSFNIGTRPVLKLDSIIDFCKNISEKSGMLTFEFGDYPQDIVALDEAKILENLYLNNELETTDRKFSINGENKPKTDVPNSTFSLEELTEYTLNNRKFVRIFPKSNNISQNGKKLDKSEPIWIEVKPIKWIANKEDGIAISEKILFSGVSNQCLNSFFHNCFIDEILQNNFFKLNRVDQNFLEQYIKHERKKR